MKMPKRECQTRRGNAISEAEMQNPSGNTIFEAVMLYPKLKCKIRSGNAISEAEMQNPKR